MFVNTKEFSPVIRDGLCKAHPKSIEYRKWWEEQRKYCIEGYSVGGKRITGDHYWYLNFWKIRGTDEKTGRKIIRPPRFIDMDYEFFHTVEHARKIGKNLCVAKRRQVGFSEKTASLVGKEFSLFPASQSIIIAGEDRYAQATMRMTMRGLNSLIDTEFFKRKTPDTVEYIQAKYQAIEGGVKVWRGSLSEIYCMTAKNNPQVTIGKSPSFILFEECGKFPGLLSAYKYIQPAMEANFKKTGFAIFIGTGGEMDAGAAELEELFYHPEGWDLMPFDYDSDEYQLKKYFPGIDRPPVGYFVPAWKFSIIDEEGNSLKQESINQILINRDEAKKAKNQNAFIQTVTQMPLSPDEAFMRTGGNRFNIQKLNAQLARIKNSRELRDMGERGDLDFVYGQGDVINGVAWRKDPNGQFLIFEHPQYDPQGNVYLDLYKGSTDSYDKDQANTSSSMGSTQIFKTFRNAEDSISRSFVARVTARPAKAEDFYEMSAKLCMYYQARNLIEWSNVGIFGWYERKGLSAYLRERPRIVYANIKDSKVNNRYGIDPSTKSYWIRAYADYIEDNAHKMFDVEQIQKAIAFREEKDYNCDITISSALAIVHELDDIHVTVKEKKTGKKQEFFHFSSSGGKMKSRFYKQEI
jgi:hypothetical protein